MEIPGTVAGGGAQCGSVGIARSHFDGEIPGFAFFQMVELDVINAEGEGRRRAGRFGSGSGEGSASKGKQGSDGGLHDGGVYVGEIILVKRMFLI